MIISSKYTFGICVILLLFSCRSQKPFTEVSSPAEDRKQSYLPEAVFASGRYFETLKAKRINVDFIINGVKENLGGNIAVSRDSLIVISVIPLLGYEALRIMCTRDSIIIINRTERTYHASSLEYYLRKYNIPAGFLDLQAVLLNEVFLYKPGYGSIRLEKSVEAKNGSIVLLVEALQGKTQMAKQEITADSNCTHIRDVYVIDYLRTAKMAVRYTGFNGCEMDSFPSNVMIDIKDLRNDIKLNIDYGQIIFNDRINVKFEVPDSYSRIYM